MRRSSKSISVSVKAIFGGTSGAERLSIVIQKTRQLRMQKSAIRLANRWAVLSFDSSTLQPDLRILWNTFDLPSQSIPLEFLNRFGAGRNGQIRDQPPVDFLSVLRGPAFLGMDPLTSR